MNRSLAGLVLLMLACSEPPASKSPSWPPTLATTRVDFTCRLPVLDFSSPGINDAFIDFPAGSLVPAGTGGFYYDEVVSRWLPVTRYSVSPDGRRYAIAKNPASGPPSPSRVYVVDAATGADLVMAVMPDQREYGVVDFTPPGVIVVPFGDPPEAGVWGLDPDTGVLTKTSDGFYQRPAGEWIGVVDPRDPNHQFSHATGSPVAMPDRIDRRDASGNVTTWFYKPGYWLYPFAFTGSPRLLVQATHVNTATGTEDYGIWMSGAAALFLIGRDGSIRRVSDHGGVPVNSCS